MPIAATKGVPKAITRAAMLDNPLWYHSLLNDSLRSLDHPQQLSCLHRNHVKPAPGQGRIGRMQKIEGDYSHKECHAQFFQLENVTQGAEAWGLILKQLPLETRLRR